MFIFLLINYGVQWTLIKVAFKSKPFSIPIGTIDHHDDIGPYRNCWLSILYVAKQELSSY